MQIKLLSGLAKICTGPSLIFMGYLMYACYPYLLPPPKLPTNKYVIISGCTDGIGRQFAKYLDQKNVPLILIGRNQNKIQALLSQLTSKSHRTLTIDFSQFQQANRRAVQEKIDALSLQKDIEGYINCCGASIFNKFQDISQAEIVALKNTNILPIESFIPLLKDRQSSFLINISSATVRNPLRYCSVYCASKAYVFNLLRAVSLQNKQLTILNVRPWFVKTKMVGYKQDWMTVSPSQVVQGSLKNLYRRKNCLGTIRHELIEIFSFLVEKDINKRIDEAYQRWIKLQRLRSKKKNNNN